MDNFILYIGTAFALVFVIEGLLWAFFPDTMKKIVVMALAMPAEHLRNYGFGMALLGVLMVYLIDLLAS
ncbi:MAG: DUF2065 domain-containing protein [Alphaproteobacteria bacterium]